MEAALQKNFDEVLARYRRHDRDEVLQVADQLREDDIYNVAIVLYRWVLDFDDSPAAHFGIGQCLGKTYDYAAALSHLDRAFSAEPERSDGASYYAYILERHGRMEEADRWYQHALQGAEANDLWARSHYAWFLEKWGRMDDACRVFEDVLDRNPAYTWASKRYALLLRSLGREDQARALVRDAVRANPGNRFAALNWVEYLLLTEDDGYDEARAELETGDEAPPWFPVLAEMFDYYRNHLLTKDPDPLR